MGRGKVSARSIAQVGTPSASESVTPGQGHDVTFGPCEPRQCGKPRPPLRLRQVIVAKDQPAAARQAFERGFEHRIVSLV